MTAVAAILTALSLMSIGAEWLKGSKCIAGWYVSIAVSLGMINLAWALDSYGLVALQLVRLFVYGRAILKWRTAAMRRKDDAPDFEPPLREP
ncbi:MAG: hypothetical protein ACO1SV_21715 [Fimbriimonas sp.]